MLLLLIQYIIAHQILIKIKYRLGATWMPFSTNFSCNTSNYILSISVVLPFRPITVQFNLPNIYLIGGVRIGLNGSGQVKSSGRSRQELGFSRTFNQSDRMLGQNAEFVLQLTKVINDTLPLVTGDDNTLRGLWIDSFTVNYYESFYSNNDYLNAQVMPSTNITLTISETPYFILNLEEPMARLPQLIFHNFLFTTMIIELFGLVFLLFNLAIIPCVVHLMRICKPDFARKKSVNSDDRHRSSDDRHRPSDDQHHPDDASENPAFKPNTNGSFNESPTASRF